MKAIEDLKALFPEIIALFKKTDHEIGESYFEQDEDGWGRYEESTANSFTFERDGWEIEVCYECCGEWKSDPGDYYNSPCCELVRAWGEVMEINAAHYNEESDEASYFSREDLEELWEALDEELKNIA